MGAVKFVKAGDTTVSDLAEILSNQSGRNGANGWVADYAEVISHEGVLDQEATFRHLRWHSNEARVVNTERAAYLQWPVTGPLLRDQHEINRLLLVGIEKAADILTFIEGEIGRQISRYRTQARSQWVRQFRYMGTKWGVLKHARRELRQHWEQGRSKTLRLRSVSGQARINLLLENCLIAEGEILATLQECFESDFLLGSSGSLLGEMTSEELEERMASCLWHAREGKALREAHSEQGIFRTVYSDRQRELNRLYIIALEEMYLILRDHTQRIGKLEWHLQPDSKISL